MTTGISRWQPASGPLLRDAFERLFDDSFVRPWSGFDGNGGMQHLPIDLFETDDAFVVRAFVPGVSSDNLDITLQSNTLTIHAQQPAEQVEGARYILRERVVNTWFRSIELPSTFNADEAEARLENGVLFLTLPKAPEARPHRISVQSS
jgi:HSP20 family protein